MSKSMRCRFLKRMTAVQPAFETGRLLRQVDMRQQEIRDALDAARVAVLLMRPPRSWGCRAERGMTSGGFAGWGAGMGWVLRLVESGVEGGGFSGFPRPGSAAGRTHVPIDQG